MKPELVSDEKLMKIALGHKHNDPSMSISSFLTGARAALEELEVQRVVPRDAHEICQALLSENGAVLVRAKEKA